ncbi:lysophospholipid acyltransferase family protein [Verrucomicrobiota bacterium]
MNRFKGEQSYTFSPPKYSRFWAAIVYWISDTFFLKRAHKIVGMKIASGGETLLEKYKNGDSLLITPNHSDHCDPSALLHLSRRFKIPVHFMAAREIFSKEKGLRGKILQRAGVFSIDREGSDLKAIKEAMRILAEGKYPLVMFPEGEIYHLNEQLTPLNEGASTLALRTARKLHKAKSGKRIFIVPTAMKYQYIDDISSSFPERLARLEKLLFWEPQDDLSVIDRIYKFGEAILSLKEKEYLNRTLDGILPERLQKFREILISREEKRYLSKISDSSHPVRVRRLRGKIRSILLDGEKPEQKIIDQCYKSLDRLYVAIQLYSYPGQYLRDKTSMDRIAETIHKFEEDLLEENVIRGKRSVEITFCEPIDMQNYMDKFNKNSKKTTTEVTQLIESEIRKILE